MITRFIIAACFVFTASTAAYSQEITREDADSMITALKKSKPDIHRLELLLGMAQFYVLKPGEDQADVDSANAYIKKATALNASLQSSDESAYILFTQSTITKEKGQREEGQKM